MTNHLAAETSPYLLQHVNNPVDWYPWGNEALNRSRELDRPIFLSIGYSACHWCHVMEHESFENAEIAALMNQWYVCIKVDREERPDLDQIYMNAVTAMTGSGGWPMSVFLTPTLKPFYGGTYWPPTARWGRPGFREILHGVNDSWHNRRTAVNDQADELTNHLIATSSPSVPPAPLTVTTLERAMKALVRAADPVHGGFGSAPKFPHPMDLRLALRCWKRFCHVPAATTSADSLHQSAAEILKLTTLTLDKMAGGGIYDHLGGGFARYSTDERWLVPHFEKMLYDNAQLVPAYLEAFQITGRTEYARVARETLDYILREMTQPQGGFYSTQDADSEGVEGKFFVWSEAEIDVLLEESSLTAQFPDLPDSLSATIRKRMPAIFKHCYDVSEHGNWEHANILNRPRSNSEDAAQLGITVDELARSLEFGRQKLFPIRSQRVWPGRDEKLLVSWNGLMIGAMSMAANVLCEPKYARAAQASADFILGTLIENIDSKSEARSLSDETRRISDASQTDSLFRLFHCYKDGRTRFNGYLDDYAALIDGLCELYQTIFDAKYLAAAVSLAERMLEQFWDENDGGFFYTSSDHETLITRTKETLDNATPSGNSLAAIGLLKLARLTGRSDFEQKAMATLEMMSGQLERIPLASGLSLMALDFVLGLTHEIVVVSGENCQEQDPSELTVRNPQEVRQILVQLHQQFVPNKVVHWLDSAIPESQRPALTSGILHGKVSLQGQTTAYFCQQGTCGPPIIGEQACLEKFAQLQTCHVSRE